MSLQVFEDLVIDLVEFSSAALTILQSMPRSVKEKKVALICFMAHLPHLFLVSGSLREVVCSVFST
jgi:hypothetical protein